MIQKRLIVKGRVQEVNYRLKVKKMARKMKVLGTIENLDDETVEIICGCDNKQHFQEFKQKIDIKSENLIDPFVEKIEEHQLENAKLRRFTIIYENIQEDMLTKLGAGIKGMDALHTEFTYLKTRYGIMGITLLIIALETVKDEKRKKMLEDILEEEVKLEAKKP